MAKEHFIYVLRPNRTSLWLPSELAKFFKFKHGHQLTEDQFSHHEIQGLIARRLAAERAPKNARTVN